MAATMMTMSSLRAPVARDAFRTNTKPSPAARKGLQVRAVGPSGGAEPSKTATSDEILACECNLQYPWYWGEKGDTLQ